MADRAAQAMAHYAARRRTLIGDLAQLGMSAATIAGIMRTDMDDVLREIEIGAAPRMVLPWYGGRLDG